MQFEADNFERKFRVNARFSSEKFLSRLRQSKKNLSLTYMPMLINLHTLKNIQAMPKNKQGKESERTYKHTLVQNLKLNTGEMSWWLKVFLPFKKTIQETRLHTLSARRHKILAL